jgi:predicted negative regulator of RcsB-dependent stress response
VTPDPNPGDPGGKTAAELAWQNVTDWFQNNAWILVALIILIVMIVIIYLYLRRNIL